MNRGKIEIEKGSIAPLQRKPWESATEKLHDARDGLRKMKDTEDRISFEQGWTQAVDSLAVFWSRFFEEGKNKFSSFQPWAGRQKAVWKKNEVMMYLYQARHISQHGIFVFEWDPGVINIAPKFYGHIKSLDIFPDGNFSLDSTKLTGATRDATVKFSGGDAALPVVVNKQNNENIIYHPPMVYELGSYRQIYPVEIVTAGIDYYTGILDAAFKKFGYQM